MKKLYESILDDMDDVLAQGDEALEKLRTFGHRFKLYFVGNCSEKTANMFNANALKKATKDLKYIDDNIERGVFDDRNKIKMLINWISNLKFSDLGFSSNDIKPYDDGFRKKLSNAIQEKAIDNGFFKHGIYTDIIIISTRFGRDVLEFYVTDTYERDITKHPKLRIVFKIEN